MAAGQWLGLPENDFPDWLLATRRPKAQRRGRRAGDRAFTLLEIMLAIMIFMMVLTAIYATWLAILKGSRAGLKAAAEVQRSRIAMRALEDAFLTVQMYTENMKWYAFETDTKGDLAAVSLVSRLPASFPGVGRYGDQIVRRVSFASQPGTNGGSDLVMAQAPMLQVRDDSAPPYSLVLARDVTLFSLEFYDVQKNEWNDEWRYTNTLPKLVRVSLGLGGTASKPHDVVSRIIALPAAPVFGVQSGPGFGTPGPGPAAPGTPGYTPGQPVPGQPPPARPGFGQPGFPAQPIR